MTWPESSLTLRKTNLARSTTMNIPFHLNVPSPALLSLSSHSLFLSTTFWPSLYFFLSLSLSFSLFLSHFSFSVSVYLFLSLSSHYLFLSLSLSLLSQSKSHFLFHFLSPYPSLFPHHSPRQLSKIRLCSMQGWTTVDVHVYVWISQTGLKSDLIKPIVSKSRQLETPKYS